MSESKHWTLLVLRVILWILAVDASIKSFLLLFGGRSLAVRLFPYPPASEVSDLLLLKQKEWGALDVTIALMLVAAARNPVAHLAIVRSMAVGLAIAGAAELVSIWALDAGRLYPVSVVLVHAFIRFGSAVALAYLAWQAGSAGGHAASD